MYPDKDYDGCYGQSAPGSLGLGGTYYSCHENNTAASGGGGGYYGGGVSRHCNGEGGSGCVNRSYLTSVNPIAGSTSMPSPNGDIETGHTGDGYARITLQ